MTNEDAIEILQLIRLGKHITNDKALEMAIKALEQEPKFDDECQKDMDEAWEQIQKKRKRIPVTLDLTPCDDAISREAVLLFIEKVKESGIANYGSLLDIATEVRNLPSVTQKSGKWQKYNGLSKLSTEDVVICDQCAFVTYKDTYYKYCPNCGAKMVEPQESEEV